jgi:outer membrane receptor protein involved in Fe transport
MNKQFTYNFNAHYNYEILNKIKATAIVGAQIFDRTVKNSFLQSETFATNLITDIGAGSKVTDYGEGFLNSRQAGIFTLHSFAYQNRYFLTLGLRQDYASSIGKTAPHIIYPKASFAVRLDRFNFFPKSIFSFFKLRTAYGESGQLPGPRDPIALLWQATTGGYGAGATLSQIGNVNIKPERIKEFEIGVETNFLNNYYLDFTYYRQNAVNSIVGKRLSPSTGLTASAVPYNVGGIKSWGIESLFKASLLQTRDYSVDFNMIVNYQYNEVTDLGGAQPIYGPFSNNVIKVGLRKHEFYLQKVLGAKFNADGTYAGVNVTSDRVDFGNPIPSYTGSFSLNVKFLKNFHLYLLTNWALDRKMYNNTKRFATMFGNNPRYNHLKAELGLTSKLPDVTRLTPGSAEYRNSANEYAKLNPYKHSNFIEKADFLKLNAVSISYNFRDLLSDFNFLRNLVVGISAKNLWTTTNYSGADVELNFAGARSLARGQDFLTLQHPRVYNLWVRLSL